jgi:hypothetical protein
MQLDSAPTPNIMYKWHSGFIPLCNVSGDLAMATPKTRPQVITFLDAFSELGQNISVIAGLMMIHSDSPPWLLSLLDALRTLGDKMSDLSSLTIRMKDDPGADHLIPQIILNCKNTAGTLHDKINELIMILEETHVPLRYSPSEMAH